MAFCYDMKNQVVVDNERDISLELLGGRADQNYVVFLFSTPDYELKFTKFCYMHGLHFSWPGDKDEYGRLRSIITYDERAYIDIGGGYPISSDGEFRKEFNEDIDRAIVCHYRFGGRYDGPIYFLYVGEDGKNKKYQIEEHR